MPNTYECFINRELAKPETEKSSAGWRSHCCVPGCYSTSCSRYPSPNKEAFWFHSFPTDKTARKRWSIEIRREEGPLFRITRAAHVCSLHFKPSDYKWAPVRKRLIRGAVPSIFPWTEPEKFISGKVKFENEIDVYVHAKYYYQFICNFVSCVHFFLSK